jgi:hypothetical protein
VNDDELDHRNVVQTWMSTAHDVRAFNIERSTPSVFDPFSDGREATDAE